MAWRPGSALPLFYALIVGAGVSGGVAMASMPCQTCTVTDVTSCLATGSFENVSCCMPVNGGAKDCFTCKREEYLCGGNTALGPPFNCVDQGVGCGGG